MNTSGRFYSPTPATILKTRCPIAKPRGVTKSQSKATLCYVRVALVTVGNLPVDVPHPGRVTAEAARVMGGFLRDKLIDHADYIHRHGEDMPGVRN